MEAPCLVTLDHEDRRLAVPTLVAAYYAWELYAPPRLTRAMQITLLALSLFCVPATFNLSNGLVIFWTP